MPKYSKIKPYIELSLGNNDDYLNDERNKN